MLRSLFLLTLMTISFSLKVWAQEEPGLQSTTVCSEKNPEVCAYLTFQAPFQVSSESQFLVHLATPDQRDVKNLKVVLWMEEHGHGTAPVKITDLGKNHFQIRNAWFVMEGKWLVKLYFTLDQPNEQISIPVEVSH